MHQCDDVVVTSFRNPVPLYCHGNCTYKWQKMGKLPAEFPCTPIIFVREVGLYKCQVSATNSTLDSAIISVCAAHCCNLAQYVE